jgi:hypothetical protein
MTLPFTGEAFFDIFRAYNEAVWPAQLLLMVLALLAVALVWRPRAGSSVAVSAVLALLWAWLALAYHLVFFARINPLAYGFAAASLAGALVIFWQGVIGRRLRFRRVAGLRGTAGAALIGFALVVYPLWSWQAGHPWPAMPTFGLPCPTTLFTIGMLAFLEQPHPRSVYVVPVLWALVGSQAAFLLDVPQDFALVPAAVAGLVFARQGARRR